MGTAINCESSSYNSHLSMDYEAESSGFDNDSCQLSREEHFYYCSEVLHMEDMSICPDWKRDCERREQEKLKDVVLSYIYKIIPSIERFPSHTESIAACQSFISLCEELESTQGHVIASMIAKQFQDLEKIAEDRKRKFLLDSYQKIVSEMSDNMHWGRIAALVVFSAHFAKKLQQKDKLSLACILIQRCLKCVENWTKEWMNSQIEWESTLSNFVNRNNKTFSKNLFESIAEFLSKLV